MARSELALRRARRAYEATHLLSLGCGLAIAAAIAVIAAAIHHVSATSWVFAGALAISLGVLAWRGGAWRRGAFAGVLAGLPPLITPIVVIALSDGPQCAGCDTGPTWWCALSCLGTSSVVGLLVGHRAMTDRSPARFTAAALSTAALTGLLGCGTIGLGGAAGVVLGLVGGGVTGWVVGGRALRPAGS